MFVLWTLFFLFLKCDRLNPIRLASRSSKVPLEDILIGRGEDVASFPIDLEAAKVQEEHAPLFIIAGTQKSGSTVMAAYLAHHPNVSFANRKELHFFDKQANYDKGLSHYLSEFNNTGNHLIMGEATPYYIASRKSCERISEAFPDVRMIVILREPVSRAYSEYQMKVRRVQEQNHLYSLIENRINRVVSCLKRNPLSYKKIENCMPVEISSHGRYGKLTRALKKAYEKLKDWQRVVNNCFSPIQTMDDRYCFAGHEFYHPMCSRNITEWKQQRITRYQFQPKKCWEFYKEGHESVKSIEDAFHKEIEEFENCLGNTTVSKRGNRVNTRIEQLDRAISEGCIKVQGGISKQYFYRSLYVVQLYHCFKSIDSSQFLFIGNRELKEDPYRTMRSVCRFLNIPCKPIFELLERNQIEDLINNKFPSFERTTAWKIKSDYQPIPSYLSVYLTKYFDAYNQLLFSYLQKDFTKLW